MKSARRGAGTSTVEVAGISAHGIWLFLGDREVFLSFVAFPWFREAPVSGVLNVERPQPHHVYWPDLDIDLHLESIEHPERYPFVSRERPGKSAPGKGTARGSPATGRTARTRRA
jgi:hypothetical protein